MEIFLARQPIFNRDKHVIAYELLSRKSNENFYSGTDSDAATSDVIFNSLLTIGLKNITDGKRAYINFNSNFIINRIAMILPKKMVGIEILEDVKITEDIVNKVKEIKSYGYMVALDDFVYSDKYEKIIPYVDIFKIDFMNTTKEYRETIANYAKNLKIKLLAEKVEDRNDFDEAYNLGYDYFQGYFFSKPVLLKSKDIPIHKSSNLRLLREIHEENLKLEDIVNIVKNDVSISYKLMKLINSSYFNFRNKIFSVEQSIALLGLEESRKWLTLLLLRNIPGVENDELLTNSLVRAKFLEGLSSKFGMDESKDELFIMGLFSNIEAFFNMPMEILLEDMPVTDEVKKALSFNNSKYTDIYKLVLYYEKGDWDNFVYISAKNKIQSEEVSCIYLEAVKWTNYVNKVY
ncbi:MAG: EAL and HDOD domain-containing protein [Clostridiaceae bacterium]